MKKKEELACHGFTKYNKRCKRRPIRGTNYCWQHTKNPNEIKLGLNPLQGVWTFITTIFGAIGLVNATEDIHKWSNFYLKLAEQYRAIVYAPFQFIHLNPPDWVKDYLFFGFLFVSSFLKSTVHYQILSNEEIQVLTKPKSWLNMVIFLLIWPLAIIKVGEEVYKNKGYFSFHKLVFIWIGTTLILFFLLLLIDIILS